MDEPQLEFDSDRDVPKLAALAEKNVWIGTSSWNYEGWIGQVYKGDYSGPRKPFVKSRFEQQQLHDVSRVFPTVCFDGGYWRLPDDKQLQKYYDALPENYQFAIKVTDIITQRTFNAGPQRGQINGDFLSVGTFRDHFLLPVKEVLGKKLGPIILEFSPMRFDPSFAPIDFVKQLHLFLDAIRKNDDSKLAVEVRNEIFVDGKFTRYLDCLEYHGVAHVLNEQTHMPPVAEQMQIPGIFPTDYTVVRALVRRGQYHDDAVEEFEPYRKTQQPDSSMRKALAKLIRTGIQYRRGTYMYVNNRREGNAPNTIANILHEYEAEGA